MIKVLTLRHDQITALYIVDYKGNLNAAKELINLGANVNWTNFDGTTALFSGPAKSPGDSQTINKKWR